jgi:AcrR family transcriptional regulator
MRKKKQEERRAQILWATIELVAEAGIEGSTMKAIAERAGVSTGMITYYFEDKDDLITSALAFGHQMVGDRTRALRSPEQGQDHLPALFSASLLEDAPDVPPLSFWIEYWAHASRTKELRDFRANRISRFRENIATTIREGVSSGRLRADLDALLTTDLLQALLDGLQLKVALDSATISPSRAMQVVGLMLELIESETSAQRQAAGAGIPRSRARGRPLSAAGSAKLPT